jgi:hypothetical protein
MSPTEHRPAAVRATVGILTFLGVSAVAGGVALVAGVGAAPPADWLDDIPLIDSWVVPGLVLGIGFGVGSLVAAYGMLRRPQWTWLRPVERLTRHHWSWIATILIGIAHIVWIVLELIYLRETSDLQIVYGATGVALVALPMRVAVRRDLAHVPGNTEDRTSRGPWSSTPTGTARSTGPGPTTDRVWRELTSASFAVVSHVTAAGEPRSSGVVYAVVGRRLFVVTAEDSWKVRNIAANGRVAVTVPVRRGGILSLLFPIPPATISFHASAVVHSSDSPKVEEVLEHLAHLLPAERITSSRVIEIRPEGRFLTYGVGVPLTRMRDPNVARARAPVG